MGITNNQDIPVEQREESKWTMRSLFPAKAMASVVSKVFTSSFEVILGVLVIVISLAELLDRDVLPLYVLTILVASAVFYERNFNKDEK